QGYSFGLNGVADVANIIPRYGGNARPFIISLDGWAGTQRYAAVWTGDQTGGEWEYIRFHIPTYIGSGLSGQPNITSDMDGIFGGKNAIVNIRDFQWKAFTPMQLNMDGWGANEKYPYALGEPATSINRTYLKLKSALLPYTYSVARQALTGLPIMRAMLLEDANRFTLGKSTQYQYMYGPYFLVAPVYQVTKTDKKGNDIRNGIYLPKGKWIDYFSGNIYEGNCIINNFKAPVWKLPLFVKEGAIIPMANPNNNVSEINKSLRIYEVYPAGKTSFIQYDDDGSTESYKTGSYATTLIESFAESNTATITVHPSKGDFNGFVKKQSTEFRINVTHQPASVKVKVGSEIIKLARATSMRSFANGTNVYFYDAAPNLNQFSIKGSEFEKMAITKNPRLLVSVAETDVTKNAITLTVKGFVFAPANCLLTSSGNLNTPVNAQVNDTNRQAFALKPTWGKVANADYYEINFNGQLYTTITDTTLLFEDLAPETNYTFKLRAVNKTGRSAWAQFAATTKMNPLQFAIKDIVGQCTMEAEEGTELSNLFDFDETSMWHTKWDAKAVPFDVVMDLRSVNQLNKIEYLPRNRGNGIWLKGTIFYGDDGTTWTKASSFEWAKNGEMKEFAFSNHPTARYIKINVTEGIGGYGSGRELYVFKVPGTESFIPGDINNDHRIDNNDLTSYINYTGLRKGDNDFEGYISKGDVNKNGLIDAYDISTVATRLDGGVNINNKDSVAGRLELNTPKKVYDKNDIVEITVKGVNLASVNALSFSLPYNIQDFEFIGITALNMRSMENMTNDRLHTNGKKILYPTFVNIGEKETLAGSGDLFVIKLRAKHTINFDLKPVDGLLVGKHLEVVKF
ncbi:MAG TPA: TIM-barrel domain-containing protein, partial [Chitinophagaceae bacterium]|nr:TIM-barrel domain-containing protein [Chitinophagaceae bacterium]